jgi:AcrR family transcriptional regulator
MVDRKQEILDAALALADEKGLAAVSMRAVAERSGVTPMALYPYVGSKAALLDGMVGRLLTGLLPLLTPDAGPAEADASPADASPADTSGPEPDWWPRLRALAYAARELTHQHPWASALLFMRPAIAPEAARSVDRIYVALLDAGVPASEVARVERLASTLVLGFAASEVGGRFGDGGIDPRARRGMLADQPLPGHQALLPWLESPVDWDAEFEADLADLRNLIETEASRWEAQPSQEACAAWSKPGPGVNGPRPGG